MREEETFHVLNALLQINLFKQPHKMSQSINYYWLSTYSKLDMALGFCMHFHMHFS